jgi:hypothetical protein
MNTEEERLKIAMDIVYSLKNYRATNGEIIDLYKDDYTFVPKLKKIINEYIKDGQDMRGKIEFEEIGKKIEYILPAKKTVKSLFVIRGK